jgi:hypothetical protein
MAWRSISTAFELNHQTTQQLIIWLSCLAADAAGINELVGPILMTNSSFFDVRANFLNKNPAVLESLLSIANSSLAATAILFNNFDSNLDQGCQRGAKFCAYVNKVNSEIVSSLLAALPTPLDGPSLKSLFGALVNFTLG